MAKLSEQERRDIALTIAGEIDPSVSPYEREQTRKEIANIVATIENRYSINSPRTFGRAQTTSYQTRSDVVRQPSQYSTWNDAQGRAVARANYEKFGPAINRAVDDYYSGRLSPPVPDATHYYAPDTMQAVYGKPAPSWAKDIEPMQPVGAHVFGAQKGIWNNRSRPATAPLAQVQDVPLGLLGSVPVPTAAPRSPSAMAYAPQMQMARSQQAIGGLLGSRPANVPTPTRSPGPPSTLDQRMGVVDPFQDQNLVTANYKANQPVSLGTRLNQAPAPAPQGLLDRYAATRPQEPQMAQSAVPAVVKDARFAQAPAPQMASARAMEVLGAPALDPVSRALSSVPTPTPAPREVQMASTLPDIGPVPTSSMSARLGHTVPDRCPSSEHLAQLAA